MDLICSLFSVSGAGKTRLALDGLCQNWGLYISCRPARGPASGSDDFNVATEILQEMSVWNNVKSPEDVRKNEQAANRTFTMLLCARIFILKQLLQSLPLLTDATTARRRWVLAQVLPPRLAFGGPSDLFGVVLRSLRNANIDIMREIIRSMLRFVTTKWRELFPERFETKFFVVIDEAQVAADHLKEYFPSTTGTDMRPILDEMYRFFLQYPSVVSGIILSGTGLSIQKTEEAVGSASAKKLDIRREMVFTDVGRFDNFSQEAYIRRYLTLSDKDSDRRLLERLIYWFSGRYVCRRSLSLQDFCLIFDTVVTA